jgi:hypothetical protein
MLESFMEQRCELLVVDGCCNRGDLEPSIDCLAV